MSSLMQEAQLCVYSVTFVFHFLHMSCENADKATGKSCRSMRFWLLLDFSEEKKTKISGGTTMTRGGLSSNRTAVISLDTRLPAVD